MDKIINNQDGLTLVELLAAMTLLGIVLVAFIPFFSQHANFVRITENDLTAANIADEVAYKVKNDTNLIEENDCSNPAEIAHSELNNYQPGQVNGKSYHLKLYVCKEMDVDDLYRARIEVSANGNERPITHVYTYISGSDTP